MLEVVLGQLIDHSFTQWPDNVLVLYSVILSRCPVVVGASRSAGVTPVLATLTGLSFSFFSAKLLAWCLSNARQKCDKGNSDSFSTCFVTYSTAYIKLNAVLGSLRDLPS